MLLCYDVHVTMKHFDFWPWPVTVCWRLICTDAAARGVDIEGIKCVVNYDAPQYLRTYIHRSPWQQSCIVLVEACSGMLSGSLGCVSERLCVPPAGSVGRPERGKRAWPSPSCWTYRWHLLSLLATPPGLIRCLFHRRVYCTSQKANFLAMLKEAGSSGIQKHHVKPRLLKNMEARYELTLQELASVIKVIYIHTNILHLY